MGRADTYDHRSVRTGHPVRNHDVSIVFVVPGTKILEKKVLFLDSGLTDYVTECQFLDSGTQSWNSISEPGIDF
jgi:hypothetical protein